MPPRGYLAPVLHAHLPYVRHPGGPALEERWFYQAVVESYLPLILALQRLLDRGTDFGLTVSLSPPLITMLADPLLQERLLAYLDNLVKLAEREAERTVSQPEFHALALYYRRRWLEMRSAYVETCRCDLLGALARLAASKRVELITTAATHGYLPLIMSEPARRAQVRAGVEVFRRAFGYGPRGFWLPECGYTPGVERLLQECDLEYFFVDTHALLNASPRPRAGPYRPLLVAGSRVAALGRDPESSRQVWSRESGYPGDPLYREYYRDIGYDLPWDYLQPFLPEGVRTDTGIKYYRITGREHKELYDPALAGQRAAQHAANFLFNRQHQIAYLAERMPDPPLVVAPYDAELFGHWWYEGPQWLEALLGMVAERQDVFRLTTVSGYLDRFPPLESARLHLASWGEGGYSHVWLNPQNDFLYPQLHQAEQLMVEAATLLGQASPAASRLLAQMARELLLAQSSDWAFILHAGTATGYARRRFETHLADFYRLAGSGGDAVDGRWLAELEARDAIFPSLDFRWFRRADWQAVPARGLSVLMLSWEYPPRVVGGISPHVHDLAQALAALGVQVHVLTLATGEEPAWEHDGPVAVYRVPAPVREGMAFRDWVLSFNARMLDFLERQFPHLVTPWDLVHAHDWLVGEAAQVLAASRGLPLVATIHATEAGRNGGLFTPEQLAIHAAEGELAGSAAVVICCSRSMRREVEGLFPPAAGKVTVIPNGVNTEELVLPGTPPPLPWPAGHPLVFFMGRLVVEKGVQVLLAAAPRVLAAYPDVRFAIAGQGPFAGELRQQAADLGVAEQVHFTGFLAPGARNSLCAQARVAVFPSLYEPFGIVALEAMALGTPVIVAATGGLAETVADGQDGLTFPPGDAEALAERILLLLTDPGTARAMAERARRKVQRDYGWPGIARRTLSVYRQVLDRREDYFPAR